MTLRTVVRTVIIDGLPEDTEIPAARWYGSGAVRNPELRPFAEIKLSGTFPGMASVQRRRLEVWIHDDEGDYDRIDKWLHFLKNTLDDAVHVQGEGGAELQQTSWLSDSTDLYDDGYRTICKMTAYDIIGKDAS